jgi:hypothetical protein
MSSTWQFNGNSIIKKIFCNEINSRPIKYKWNVILNDNLHVRLEDELLDKLNLTEIERKALSEARINSRKLAEKNSKQYEEIL